MAFCLAGISSAYASTLEEKRLGRQLATQIYHQLDLSSDPVLLGAISRITQPLAQASEWRDEPLYLFLINNVDLNAFAAPGGVIGIHTGLLKVAQNTDQLASVIAHELAHLTQRHFARRMDDNQKLNTAYLAGTLIALAAGLGGETALGSATFSATQAAAIDQQLAFSRSHEREADQIGQHLMQKSGRDPAAAVQMLSILQDQQRLSAKPLPYLSTHPVGVERVADATARTGLPMAAELDPEFRFWQSRVNQTDYVGPANTPIRVSYQLDIEQALLNQQFPTVIELSQQAQLSFPNDFAIGLWKALALAETDNADSAMRELERLAEVHSTIARPYEVARDIARRQNWSPEYHLYAGLAAYRAGDWELAGLEFNKAGRMQGMAGERARALLKQLSAATNL